MMNSTYDKLIQLVEANIYESVSIKEILEDTKLIEELQFDSVNLIQLIVDIEDEFGISLSDDDLLSDKLNTPGELYEMICEAMEKQKYE